MKQKLSRLSRRYVTALRKHLKQGPRANLQPAHGLGRQAVEIGLETLDLAKIHEQALGTLDLSDAKNGMIKQAEAFFAEAITPIEKTHRAAREAHVDANQLKATLNRRTIERAASDRHLKQGIVRRKVAEKALKKSGKHYTRLLKESRDLQNHLRHLTHRLLSAQEDKRKRISRNLHDEIAQTLLGINVRLLTLRTEASVNSRSFQKEIASTHRLVEKSVITMRRVAREFKSHHET